MERLTKLSWRIFVFLIPTQLAYHFWPDWAFVFGIRVDYLSPTIYLTDILFFVTLLLALLFKQLPLSFKKTNYRFVFWILGFAIVNIVFAFSPPVAFYRWIKLLEFFFVFVFIKNLKSLSFKEDFLKPLLFSGVLFSLLGVIQFLKGTTVGGALYFLGERNFNSLTPGISLVKITGHNFLRAYSTFPHPNSLAGYFSLLLILMLTQKKTVFPGKINLVFLASIILGIVLSFSLGAWLGLLATWLIYLALKTKPYVFTKITRVVLIGALTLSFLLIVSPFNFSERISLAKSAGAMTIQNPIFGVGLNNFVVNLPNFSRDPEISWLLQPVHNIYLLALSEAGILGFCSLFLILNMGLKNSATKKTLGIYLCICFVVLVGSIDHYFLTIQQNALLLSIILGYSQRHGEGT